MRYGRGIMALCEGHVAGAHRVAGGGAAAVRAPGRRADRARPLWVHEVEFIRLEPGKTAADVLAWLKTQEGPPPGEAFGGTAVLQTGQVNYVSAEFTQGEYAMVCFVPDAADGRPHTAHGMVREFRVN